LGKIYSDGCGEKVAKDPVKAYVWTSLAAKQGLQFAKTNLEELEGQLHPYLVADAQREVEERLRNFTPATRRGHW
jgi:TPR repeat protein